ncbi:MAG: efflux transporter outer membrane subunit [Alphaproteobacteria bacterium]
MRPIRLALVLSGAAALAGCVVGPDYVPPTLSLPASFSEQTAQAGGAADLSRWWQRLGDLDLDGLIEAAVAGNLDVAEAKARIQEARATYRQAGGALLPTLDAQASASRNRSGGLSTGGDATYSQFQAGFDASYEIDLFGARRRGVEAAFYGLGAANEEMRATLLTLIGDVASNYVDARGFQARIALARRSASSQRETAELTRNKFEAGAVSALDVASAAGQASSTEANIPTLEIAYTEAVHRLSVLTGRAPRALAEQLEEAVAIPMPKAPVPTGVPADLLRARPDVRLAERELAQSTALIGQAEAARYPSINLTGSIATSALKVGDLANSSAIGWSIGPNLTLPLFNGGQLAAAVEIAEAERDQSYLAFRASVLTALEDVENALIALDRERARYRSLKASATSFREAARLARSLYDTGASSFLDVLDAERSLYSAEDALIESGVAITTDYIALNKALGGGWDGEVDMTLPADMTAKAGES